MVYNPAIHHRRSIRLPGYDYSQPGAYFITLCTHHHSYLFGKIDTETMQSKMVLSQFGVIVQTTWFDLIHHNNNIELDEFVVMPNHVHGIIFITDSIYEHADSGQADSARAGSKQAITKKKDSKPALDQPARLHALPEIVRQLKTFSARRINALRKTPGVHVWHRNYYEHIIRNDSELQHIRQYIIDNPRRWMEDEYYQR